MKQLKVNWFVFNEKFVVKMELIFFLILFQLGLRNKLFNEILSFILGILNNAQFFLTFD